MLKALTTCRSSSDPSHGTGVRKAVPADDAGAAVAAGADGLIVEVHPDPPTAPSPTAPQSLDFAEFEKADGRGARGGRRPSAVTWPGWGRRP